MSDATPPPVDPDENDPIFGSNEVDPLKDAEDLDAKGARKNFAKVGSSRPSSLMFTYGPGAIMELPNFTVMATGYDSWDRIYNRAAGTTWGIHAPKLLDAVRVQLRTQVEEIRRFPVLSDAGAFSDEAKRLGIPAVVFPQWLRCTGCDELAPLKHFTYANTNPFRPDQAAFIHENCRGRGGGGKGRKSDTVPARYLLACTRGHLDEFPYVAWVHRGGECKVELPSLKMLENVSGRGSSATIECISCGARRPMNEAQGAQGKTKLPQCRGRHPHRDEFQQGGCEAPNNLLLIGASNLWFPVLQSVIVMPMDTGEERQNLADRLRVVLGERLVKYADDVETLRDVAEGRIDLTGVDDGTLLSAVQLALNPPSTETLEQRKQNWSRNELLVPEWRHLQLPAGSRAAADPSGLVVRQRERHPDLTPGISRVLALDSLRSVSALLGFTRIDELDRIDDEPDRVVGMTTRPPKWVVGAENRGEGIFIQLDEPAVAAWESKVLASKLFRAHEEAHNRNFANRFSETATEVDPATRFLPPRYWLLHTFSHVLLREMAMTSGYGAASIAERIYAWPADDERGWPAAAGVILMTTSSDSDGTLGGLAALSEASKLRTLVRSALKKAMRCSSDPICSHRTPVDPEDFLHGAACHCCAMASETSCERANRFLDRRFLVPLPGDHEKLAFFDEPA